jgi:pimeloyl-ACP methyl ester carboxylesterase
VIGGDGPPLLLVHGWPETWYAWRMLMPTLARDFQVIAVDQRGIGLSDKPEDGYDTGMPIAYAVAADHRDRLDRLVVSEAPLPGVSPHAAAVPPPQLNAKFWHLAFNQLPAEVNEQLVRGREDMFFGAEFAASAGTNKLPDDAVKYYIDILRSGPDALRGSFELYRAFPTIIAQNQQRKARRLTLPVLAIGGVESGGEGVAGTMKLVADDVQGVVLAGTGHWVAEQAPEELLAALTAFLAPTGLGFSHERRPALGTTWPAAHRRAGARGLRRRLQLERRHRAVAAAGLHRRRPGQPAARPGPDSAYIASVVNQIDGPVLLVGHSYGGAVITSAAATATGVVGLVFVAAFAPDEGERLGEVEASSTDSILNTALVQRQYPTGQDSETAVEFAINPALFREAFAADLPPSRPR